MNIKTITKLAAALALVGIMSSARALTFADAIGTVRSGEPAGSTDETGYVNHLLSLAMGATETFDGHAYAKFTADTGTVGAGVQNTTGDNTGTGVGFLLAKYDGPNGGDVLFKIDGAFTIPQDSGTLWENDNGKGYGLSHYTYFRGGSQSVPDGGASAALIGMGLLGLAAFRRK
jgi:hypothetical protein